MTRLVIMLQIWFSQIDFSINAKHILDSPYGYYMGREGCLVSCPKCGTEVTTPVKTWPIPSRKPLDEGEKPRLAGIFECPDCKARFRAAVKIETRTEETANIENMVERIKCIKGELGQTLVNLREKISTLEIERANLMIEIGKLRKVAESRVNVLESEVGMLREEVRSLRDLLGYREEEK